MELKTYSFIIVIIALGSTVLTGGIYSAYNREIEDLELQAHFSHFISIYSKSYPNENEYNHRYQIFKDNLGFILRHNENMKSKGYELGMNRFGDLTLEEFSSKYLSQTEESDNRSDTNEEIDESFLVESPTDKAMRELRIPTVVDWRLNNTVTPVKTQKEWVSGWAFSTVAALEGAYAIAHDSLVDLSAQQLIDCTNGLRYKNSGWKGGNIANSFGYAHEVPICDEEDYPYKGVNSHWTDWESWISLKFVRKSNTVKSGDRLALYTAITQQPVSLQVDAASKDWQFYKDGILDVSWSKKSINHFTTAVGFNFTEETYLIFFKREVKYVILKNSWGPDWGINGYIHVNSNKETGEGSSCIYTDAIYPTV